MLTLPMSLTDGWKRIIIGENRSNNKAEDLFPGEESECMRSAARTLRLRALIR